VRTEWLASSTCIAARSALKPPWIFQLAQSVTSFALDSEESGIFALGLDTGETVVARYGYDTRFAQLDNRRILTPKIDYPFGNEPYRLSGEGNSDPVASLAIRTSGENMLLAATSRRGGLKLLRASKQTSLFAAFDLGGGADFEIEETTLDGTDARR
jgi:hypothetical protein